MSTPNITSRAWLTEVLDKAGEVIAQLDAAGATLLEATWDVGDVTVTAKKHGDGVTIATKKADGTVPVQPLKVPAGWLTS